jgi:hypothetical protein
MTKIKTLAATAALLATAAHAEAFNDVDGWKVNRRSATCNASHIGLVDGDYRVIILAEAYNKQWQLMLGPVRTLPAKGYQLYAIDIKIGGPQRQYAHHISGEAADLGEGVILRADITRDVVNEMMASPGVILRYDVPGTRDDGSIRLPDPTDAIRALDVCQETLSDPAEQEK